MNDTDPLDRLPLAGPDQIAELAPVLVVAPHPDDETLGAGGLIALLREQAARVDVVLFSDGAASHPDSRTFPPERLAALRRHELAAALRILGVDAARHVHALGYPDGSLPGPGSPGYDGAVHRVQALIRALEPRTVLVPWRRDPHDDHRASFEIASRALSGSAVRRLEYPIWLRIRGAWDDWPQGEEMNGLRVDIGPLLERKHRAVMAHTSQATPLIGDAAESFCLTGDVLARLVRRHEVFLEPA